MKISLAGLLSAVAALLCHSEVDAKAVFAHFMVGNVQAYSVADWEADISLAQQAGIDGFALNIAAGDTSSPAAVAKGFQAAQNKGFKLFFSFDYAAWGAWDKNRVIDLVNQYKTSAAYWKQNNQPLVSTFEGTNNINDWPSIKSSTGAFFIPDWSSMGPSRAAATGVVDGLFSWAAWPNGPSDMTVAEDQAYKAALGGKPYMMGVSPWFYTNLPGWNKNWVWRGDDLWYDRWQQVMALQPELVEIITWNDYGESHYIGPLRESGFSLFQSGGAPFNYARDMPHDGWRTFLPYLIQQYKTGVAAVPSRAEEGVTVWYRRNPGRACGTGGTTGNTASHGQQVYHPADVAQDRIFFSALVGSGTGVPTASVSIGGNARSVAWESMPSGAGGLYHGSAQFDGRTGDVVVTVSRDGRVVGEVRGPSITTSCTAGIVNWNAWVGSSR